MSSNRLEIITRGSVEILAPDSTISPDLTGQTTTATDVKSDECMHTGLEPLPPERPRYSEELLTSEEDIPHYLENATQELAQSQLQTENLLHRIEALSGRIRSGLSLVEGTGTTVPVLPPNGDDVMTIPSDNTHQEETGAPTSGEEISLSEKQGEEGEGEEGERGCVDSSQPDDVDPRLIKALEKMKRLDERLADIVKREREVKEQRKQLEMQITGVTFSFSTTDDEGGVPPVFQTQVLEDHTECHADGSMPLSANDTDFLQRNNIEEGGEVLSEAERCRLEQLLAQDEESSEIEDYQPVPGNIQSNGFTLSTSAQTALRHIDNQLQALSSHTVCETVSERHTSPELEAQRLIEIEERLAVLQKQSGHSSPSSAQASILHHLLEECSREQNLS